MHSTSSWNTLTYRKEWSPISDPLPRGIQIAPNGNRPQCIVKYADNSAGNAYVFGTALVLYFKPTKCVIMVVFVVRDTVLFTNSAKLILKVPQMR